MKLKSLMFSLLALAFGIIDASACVAAADAAAAAAAVNDAGTANATPGVDNVGVHTTGAPANTDTARIGAPDFIEDPVDQKVVKMFNSSIPIDQICRHLPKVKQNGMRYEFWSVDTRPVSTVTTEEVEQSVGVEATIKVANSDMFDETDIILIPSVLGYDFNSANRSDKRVALNLYVKAVSSGSITVQAVNGAFNSSTNQMTVPYIPAGAKVFRLGHAASEGDVQTTPYSVLPQPDTLFMQIFKAQLMETTISIDSDKRVKFDYSDKQQLCLYNMRKEIEACYIWGVKGYFMNSTTKRYVYTCSGAIQQILEKGTVIYYDYTKELKEDALIQDIVKPIYLGNSGSAVRYAFMGSDLVGKIATIPGVQRQMSATSIERRFGVDWKNIHFMSWQLSLYQHPMLDEFGLSKCAIVLDLANVNKEVFKSLYNDALDLVKAGLFDGQSDVWTEISSIALKYPKTHAFICDVSSYAPSAPTGEESSES